MADATNTAVTFDGASPAGAVFVAPTSGVPANCVCIAISNPSDSGETLYFAVQSPIGNPKVGDAAVVNTNCGPIDAGQSFTLCVDVPGSVTVLYAASGAMTASIVYKNRLNGQL